MGYFLGAFSKFADFSGRAQRKEYWIFILIYMLIYIALAVIDAFLGTMVLALIFSLVLLVPSISIATRRLHDTGRTGWWQLIAIIPLIGIIVLIVFLVQDSHDENSYGPNPKLA
ncbi:MAG: DUF805 domain-containing protein [Gammaproteobacteria bacterium]|nr:DUF805 domain-containing protein [Gammaproteobacteria bacterium]